MKYTALLLALLTLPLFGCAPRAVDFAALPAPAESYEVCEGITLRLAQREYPVGVQSLTMLMENRGDSVMLYGNGWSFERWQDGGWQPLENRENAAWTAEGYTLMERSMASFNISTFALKEPLKEGLYRATGCALRVAEDDGNLSYGGEYTEYPPYRLEFLVKEGACPEPPPAEDGEEPGGLPHKEDWEWHTPWELLSHYEGRGRCVWQYMQEDSGLMAMLWREGSVSDGLNAGDKLGLAIGDRATGRIWEVLPRYTLEQDGIRAVEGGFAFDTERGEVYITRRGESLSFAGEWQQGGEGYSMELEGGVYPCTAEEIPFSATYSLRCGWVSWIPMLEALTGEGWQHVGHKEGLFFCGVMDPLPLGETQRSLPLDMYDSLLPGLYRIAYSGSACTGEQDGVMDNMRDWEMDALFVLE